MAWRRRILVLGLQLGVAALFACSPDGDPMATVPLVTGGQSGTDGTHMSVCRLDVSRTREIGLQEPIEHLGITPFEALVRIHGRRTLTAERCDEQDDLLLDVNAQDTAYVVPGTLVLEDGTVADCEAIEMSIDARITSADGTVDAGASVIRFWPMRLAAVGNANFEGESFVTISFDVRSFEERAEARDDSTASAVRAVVYDSGEIDEKNGFPTRTEPLQGGRVYRDVAPSCTGFPPFADD